MSKARMEILRMVAEGKVSPEDGERLLDALQDGEGETGGPRTPRGKAAARDAAENLGKALEDAVAAVRSAAGEGVRAVQRIFDEHRPETEPVPMDNGAFDLPENARLRIQPAVRVSIGGGSAGGAISVRGVEGARARILQGSAAEVHRNDREYVLTWAKSSLVVEVPKGMEHLAIRGLGGNVELSDYAGPFRVESIGGNVSVVGAPSPFKIRAVGGSVRVHDLAVTAGLSHVRATGGDIEVVPSADAQVEIQATTTLGGNLEMPKGTVRTTSRTRRRGVLILGDGHGRLGLDTLAGWIRVQADHLESDPSPEETPIAGEFEDAPLQNAEGETIGHGAVGRTPADRRARPRPPADAVDDDPDPWLRDDLSEGEAGDGR